MAYPDHNLSLEEVKTGTESGLEAADGEAMEGATYQLAPSFWNFCHKQKTKINKQKN